MIPVLVWLVALREHRRRRYAERWASPGLLPNLVDRPPGRRRYVPVAILLVALAALIVGVARPHATVSVKREEATVLLAIDTSRSMGSADISPSRLAAAQNAAYRFLDIVPAKFRVGVVQFSSRAQLAIAPTQDRNLVRAAIGSLRPGEGTAIGDAVVLSAELGQKQRASRRHDPADDRAPHLRRRTRRRPHDARRRCEESALAARPGLHDRRRHAGTASSATSCRPARRRSSACRRARRPCS